MDDPFIRTYIDDVLRSLRTQWILELIKSYTRVEIAYLSRVRKCTPAISQIKLTVSIARAYSNSRSLRWTSRTSS